MIDLISRYRTDENINYNTFIGCRILVGAIFFQKELWFDLPTSWSSNIVGGKRYSTDTIDGRELWNQLQERASLSDSFALRGFSESQARYGGPTLVAARLGQGAFRIAITEAYHRQCALTDGKVLPALDAAHIRPYANGGEHSKSNGILLRKDIHSVFDSGYATIDEDYRFVVSDKIRDVFNNGNEYRRLHGHKIRLPFRKEDYPSREALRWHNAERFLG
jgi:putative restriction endonuclease